MSDEEDGSDIVTEMNAFGLSADILQQIFAAKSGDPNKFQSFWEMDEEDVEEESMEEIQKDPRKKILWAAENNELAIVRDLLETDPGLVSSRDSDGYTPLHRAAYNGHLDMIKLLLDNGADVLAETNDGWHPLHSASRWNQTSAASLLLQRGANINARTHSDQTPLHIAASDKESMDCLKALVTDKSSDISLINSLGETAYVICKRTSEHYKLFEQRPDFMSVKT
ncbi:ANR49-like protein [Mya arenaria]|uniref:ANR49-like protein n=1 Tax=Mya arenaria TaxID=6604 RepID=A0ABY7E1H4_MYAAR|nr:ankyrin repeat domain-containing protein 49-like [Mya arenaria]WAR02807.1 ANR49-like protein [Mya arenaria]